MTSSPRIVSPSTDTATGRPFPRPQSREFRYLTAEEGDKLRTGDAVTILDASGNRFPATVRGCTGDSVKVVNRQQHVFVFDLDDPNYWPDWRKGARHAPQCEEDGQTFYLVTNVPDASDDEESRKLVADLHASVKFEKLAARVLRCESNLSVHANLFQGRPTREEYDALHAEVRAIAEEMKAIRSLLTPRAA